ncbi:ATP-binding protein, partial [Desulfovibrio sp. DV]|uniref:ATP-binding protein n=1 Tax=Desulfovibrio sp. DV TaxID=1844708 RepID=UPI000ACEB956
DSLFSILGYEQHISKALSKLEEGSCSHIHISGPPGSGKTSLAFCIAEAWKSLNGVVLVTRCEEYKANNAFNAVDNWIVYDCVERYLSAGIKAAINIVDRTLGKSGILKDIYSGYKEAAIGSAIVESQCKLSDTEAALLFKIWSLADTSPFILIVDDAHHLDGHSFSFLKRMKQNSDYKVFRFLKNHNIIFVSTTPTNKPSLSIQERITDHCDLNITTKYCAAGDVGKILNFYGAKKVHSLNTLDKIYEITKGHLRILKEIAKHINERNKSVYELVTSDNQKVLAKIVIENRLSDGNANHEQEVVSFLKNLSIIGNSASYSEVKCLSATDIKDIDSVVKAVESLTLADKSGKIISFPHECIRKHFLEMDLNRNEEIHSSFAECLRILSPQDYGTRGMHLYGAGKKEVADEMVALEWLKILRENPGISKEEVEKTEISPEIYGIYLTLAEAIKFYHIGNFPSFVKLMQSQNICRPSLLSAEKSYLHALSLALTKSKRSRKVAYDILLAHNDLFLEEFEIGGRIKLLQIYLLNHLGEKKVALMEESRLINFISENMNDTPVGDFFCNILKRRSEFLYADEVAAVKLFEARDYWKGSIDAPFPRYPQEYYRTSSNLCATLCYLGNYVDAVNVAKDVISSNYYTSYNFQRPEYLTNNYLMASFLGEKIHESECYAEQFKITQSSRAEHDNILTSSNLAIYGAYCNQLGQSLSTLESLWLRMNRFPDFEPFFLYLVASNLYTLSCYTEEKCSVSFDEIKRLSALVDPDEYGFISMRLDAIMSATEKGRDIKEWDLAPTQKYAHLGPGWDFYGRRLLFSGIHSWVDI